MQTPAVESYIDCQPSAKGAAASSYTVTQTPDPAAAALAASLNALCRARLAHYKAPRFYVFTSEFPLTVTGKIQKYRMAERGTDLLCLHNVAPAHPA
jgi:acyl-CoA synthetase (AMP-forming)/AMP-acid ligase II